MTTRRPLLFLPWLLASPGLQAAPTAPARLQIVTEELPPYNYTAAGRVTGLSTEVVEAVLRSTGLSGDIQSMPWARAYDLALNGENVLIYSMARTPAREALFKWVGTVAPTDWYLFSVHARPHRLNRLDEARALRVAAVNQDGGEQYLLSKGFQPGRNLQTSTRPELNYDKLRAGRVDLWIANELNALYLARQAGDDPQRTLVRSLRLTDVAPEPGLAMAFSRKTPDALVTTFRRGLAALKKNGTYDALRRRWL